MSVLGSILKLSVREAALEMSAAVTGPPTAPTPSPIQPVSGLQSPEQGCRTREHNGP